MMNSDRALWPVWSQFLKFDGVKGLVSFLLEAGGPLTILAAQAIYLGQPLLGQAGSTDHFKALAGLLEDREEARLFADYLKEGKTA